MKVLHVIPSVSDLRGGPSIMVRTLAAGLTSAGVQVDVAATDDDGPGRLELPEGGVYPRDGVTYRLFPRQIRFYTVSWPLFSWLARHVSDYHAVHVHALFSFAPTAAAFWARRRGVPYVVRPLGTLSRWGMQNRRPLLKRLSLAAIEDRILRGAARVHCTSLQEKREIAELGVEARFEIIPNAVDVPDSADLDGARMRRRYPKLADRKWILFLSRLDAKKGLDLLLEAFAGLQAPRPLPVLFLVGDGEPEFVSRLRRLVESLGIEDRVVFTGFLRGRDKWDALAAADLFALPSYSENFGIAVAEAMACGLPVVVSDQVAIHHEVSEAGAGRVTSCDPDAVREALADLLREGPAPEMRERARQAAREQFSTASVVTRLIRLYEAAVTQASCL